ncbi:MAG: STAS domain-containing protein [Desulfotalea sp.]
MELVDKKVGDNLVLSISGRLDVASAPDFDENFQKYLDSGEKNIIIDMSGIEYLSSAGLRSVLVSAKKIKAVKGEISFCALQGMVDEVFTISGFKAMFNIYETLEDATA